MVLLQNARSLRKLLQDFVGCAAMCFLSLFPVVQGGPSDDKMLMDALAFWNLLRDIDTGLWCDSLAFGAGEPACGQGGQLYSSAGTGMGLVSECVAVELQTMTRDEGISRVTSTLNNIISRWPREPAHGFFEHFTDSNFSGTISEYSTIDTAIMTAGALFAGNFFGGQVQELAIQLFKMTDWSQVITSAEDPSIAMTVDSATGAVGGNLKPFNEYFILACLTVMQNPDPSSKASQYFRNFFGFTGEPAGSNGFPVHEAYDGYELLSDHAGFVSSFIPQFCFFLVKAFHDNAFYATQLFPNWLHADMQFWSSILDDTSQVWGKPVQGLVWGCGAGDSPHGYEVDAINNSASLTFSAAIMAGFLPAAGPDLKLQIVSQLQSLYDSGTCAYDRELGPGRSAKILWRCSVQEPEWRASRADSIDFSTFVLGYSSRYLSQDFFALYAAGLSDGFALEEGHGSMFV